MIYVDLMLPGVVGKERGGETVQGLEKGQTCAVALVGNGYVCIKNVHTLFKVYLWSKILYTIHFLFVTYRVQLICLYVVTFHLLFT